jgi:hypothetical protein
VHPRLAVSNPAEDDGFLMAIKFRGKTSFGGKVKPSVTWLRHVKEPYSMNDILHRLNSLPSLKFLLLRYQMSLLVTARELWLMTQE